MKKEQIAEIGVDASGRLYVTPANGSYPFIYRSGMEVNWDEKGKFLFSPKPKEKTYAWWFKHILSAVSGEYGVSLVITSNTRWQNIEAKLKEEILQILQ